MFAYSDPTGTGLLQEVGALQDYREEVARLENAPHSLRNSAYTLREAFDELAPGTRAESATVKWQAFPVAQQAATHAQIDRDRFRLQEEYIEWRAESASGALTRVTFTTEFTTYYEALAKAGAAALKQEISRLIPGANPTDAELFGAGFNPATASKRTRADRFVQRLPNNPWNNGERGILCLTQPVNTLGALFGLLGPCAVPDPDVDPGSICGGSFCVPGRNSDPAVCIAAQNLARADRSFSLQDPFGIRIITLEGEWTVDGNVVDINDEQTNRGLWKVSRNGRRGTLTLDGDVRLNGAKVKTGAEVSLQLFVGAEVLHAPNAALPEWARTGKEGLRGPDA
jgi:hypothetical protein